MTVRTSPRRRGAAAVEMALMAPLLVILLLGLWELGRMIQTKQAVANAAREGGRQAATGQKTVAQIQQYIRTSLGLDGVNTAGMPDPVITRPCGQG
jgi:Flp pilus assembly protein TadG